MKFAKIPVAEAEGAILAHSTGVSGLRLKKGRRLSGADLDVLSASGVEEVVAARLDTNDVAEDRASEQLAAAIAGTGVDIGEPFTGRVNLFAAHDGLLNVDKALIDLFNRVSETITFATLPEFSSVTTGQMVGTIKIIPFATPRSALDLCLDHAGAGLASVAPFRKLTVRLVQTELPGIAQKVLDKTNRITGERIAALGSKLVSETRCAHTIDDLAGCIGALARYDILLIAGASAITDRRDVLPAAIEQAGGTVRHFGMPVDPGNLLLLAELNGKPVIGLPGCARSPKLNGFDWVLQRLAAGIDVTADDIMEMGVGGLLSEITTRPQPRAGKRRGTAQHKIAAIILAAGQSRRMGRRNKLLIEIDGKTMLRHVVDEAQISRAAETIVVTGHEAARVQDELGGIPVKLVHNSDYAGGLSGSLKRGLEALGDDIDGALVCLGDMPLVTSDLLDRLIGAFDPPAGRAIIVPTRNGKRGNPVLWSRDLFADMKAVEGDVGARHLIGLNADIVAEVELPDAAAFTDFDTPEAIDAFQRGPL